MTKLLIILIKVIMGLIFLVALIVAGAITIAASPVVLIVVGVRYLLRPKKYRVNFDRLRLTNRWKTPRYSRLSNWTIIGISERWSDPENFCFKFCFFGLDLNVWFRREFLDDEKWEGI